MSVQRASCFVLCLLLAGAVWGKTGLGLTPGSADAQDLQFRSWKFDRDRVGLPPAGFSSVGMNGQPVGGWTIEADAKAPTPPNVLMHRGTCATPGCLRTLVLDGATYEFPDLTVRLRLVSGDEHSGGGVILGAVDAKNFHAVLLNPKARILEVIHVRDGAPQVLVREQVEPAPARGPTLPGPSEPDAHAWHLLRVQHNTILSKAFLEISVDNELAASVREPKVGSGRIGLVTRGDVVMGFDFLNAFQLYSQRPLSSPAPYTD